MCVFLCANNMHKPIFSASKSAPERHVARPHNNTHNRRPFFCVLSAQIYVNDKIYIKRNKVAKKYLKIRFSGIIALLHQSVPAYPPRGAADNTPYPFSKFFIFLFFSIGVYLVFPLSLCILRVCIGRWRRSRRTDGNHQTWV